MEFPDKKETVAVANYFALNDDDDDDEDEEEKMGKQDNAVDDDDCSVDYVAVAVVAFVVVDYECQAKKNNFRRNSRDKAALAYLVI